MKAEERHRLQENDLHRLTEHARERTRPFFDRYGVALLLGLAAVLIVIAAVVWWSKRSSSDRGEGWEALAAAFRSPGATAEDFGEVADAYPESRAAVWARLYEGDARLRTGIESLFSDKEGAMRDLTDAQAAFEDVLARPELNPEVAVRGMYGLARTLEATSDGDLQPAIERYEQIIKDYPGSIYENLAQERLDALSNADAKAFYAWFSKAKPTLQDPLLRPQDRAAPTDNPFAVPGGPAFPTGDSPAAPGTTAGETAPVEAPRPKAAAPADAGETDAATEPADTEPAETEPAAPADNAAASESPVPAEEPSDSAGPSLGGPD